MKFYPFLLLILMITACKSEPVEQSFWKVSDVQKSEDRIAMQMEGSPDILNIHVKGQTDGNFQIIASGAGQNKTFELQGGTIDTIFSDYWKSPVCKTIYVPKSITTGEINISTLIYPK